LQGKVFKKHSCCKRGGKIGHGSAKGRENDILSGIFEITGIYRHRLCPAKMEEKQTYGPNGINMADWVQCEPSRVFGSRVTKGERCLSMRVFMDSYGKKDDKYPYKYVR